MVVHVLLWTFVAAGNARVVCVLFLDEPPTSSQAHCGALRVNVMVRVGITTRNTDSIFELAGMNHQKQHIGFVQLTLAICAKPVENTGKTRSWFLELLGVSLDGVFPKWAIPHQMIHFCMFRIKDSPMSPVERWL